MPPATCDGPARDVDKVGPMNAEQPQSLAGLALAMGPIYKNQSAPA